MEIKPQALAIPRETDKLEKGKYGPIYPKTPACYGFSIVAKIIPGREPVFCTLKFPGVRYAPEYAVQIGAICHPPNKSLASMGPVLKIGGSYTALTFIW